MNNLLKSLFFAIIIVGLLVGGTILFCYLICDYPVYTVLGCAVLGIAGLIEDGKFYTKDNINIR